MGKKMNKTVKETLQIVIFLLVVGILLTGFVIYPLNRTKTIMGRPNVDDYNRDSLPANDPTLFVEAGLPADTFSVEPDVVTRLCGLYLPADSSDSVRGTVLLLHADGDDMASMLPLATAFHDSGFMVAVYDQRASGCSGGKYRGEGQLEASDLIEVIAHLDYREMAPRPLSVVGFGLGGDAAMLAGLEEERIDRTVAVDPYLTTERMLNSYRAKYDTYWLPFFNPLFYWWYDIRSGYASPYRDIESIEPVERPTLVLGNAEELQSPEYKSLQEQSDSSLLTVEPYTVSDGEPQARIVSFVVRP